VKIRHITLTVFFILIFLASNIYAVSVSYYQGDGKGWISDTDGREVRSSGSTGVNSPSFYPQGDSRRIYIGFFNIFGTAQDQIPEGSTITSANFRIVKTSGGDYRGSGTLYKATSAWTEDSITWSNKPSYSTAQGDKFSFNYGYFTNRIINFTVTDIVQQWADDPSVNFGWMFTAIEEDGGSSEFASDDYYSTGRHPMLTVTYEAPDPDPDPDPEPEPATIPEPATLILFGAGLAGIIKRFKK